MKTSSDVDDGAVIREEQGSSRDHDHMDSSALESISERLVSTALDVEERAVLPMLRWREHCEAVDAANALIRELLEALTRLMKAERAASKADREAIIAARFTGLDQVAAFHAQGNAGRELTAAWEAARAAIAKAEGHS